MTANRFAVRPKSFAGKAFDHLSAFGARELTGIIVVI
jgi:hypothetical protein